MSFKDLIKSKLLEKSLESPLEEEIDNNGNILLEKEMSPEDILRDAGYKIKLVTKTSFGIQIDLAKSQDAGEIKKILKDFEVKIKNNSIFVIT